MGGECADAAALPLPPSSSLPRYLSPSLSLSLPSPLSLTPSLPPFRSLPSPPLSLLPPSLPPSPALPRCLCVKTRCIERGGGAGAPGRKGRGRAGCPARTTRPAGPRRRSSQSARPVARQEREYACVRACVRVCVLSRAYACVRACARVCVREECLSHCQSESALLWGACTHPACVCVCARACARLCALVRARDV